ncbi:hypothetical protein KQX54_001062 [Cotesia glomerata]|uniref:Uncharacterized protein n=1 Tax=Cotesia glomerata TaxID=32391 RepID=A0AAV7IWD6_COTGL|nr:hypothetical protein KQX54_001062 [Cotesia glomerata]
MYFFYSCVHSDHCPTISPLVCAEKEVQKTFVLRAYIRFTASTLSTHPVYCVLQTGRGGERDKKPKKKTYKTEVKNFLSRRVLDVLHEGEMTWTCESGQVTQG